MPTTVTPPHQSLLVPEIEIEEDVEVDEVVEEPARTTLGDLDALQELRDQINQQRSTE